MKDWADRWPQRLCTEDERQRMGMRASSDEGGPFGRVLAAHPARLHWRFLLVNFIRRRTWPVGRSVVVDDMRVQWLRIGGGWSLRMLFWSYNRRMRGAGHYELQFPPQWRSIGWWISARLGRRRPV